MDLYLKILAGVIFAVAAALNLFFGSSRGSRQQKVNSNTILLFLVLMSTWYFMAIKTELTLEDWARDDGLVDIPLLRFITGLTVSITIIMLISYRIKQDVIDVLMYTVMTTIVTAALLLSVLLFEAAARRAWMWASVAFATYVVVLLIRDTLVSNIMNVRFVRFIVFLIGTYLLWYVVLIIMSPMNEALITGRALDITMTLLDLAISLVCALSIVHYGWTLAFKPHHHFSPGEVSRMYTASMSSGQLSSPIQFIDTLHIFP